MLTCRDFAHRHASDYLDRQLGWRARLGVRVHLLLCDNCRRFLAQLRQVRTVLLRRSASAPVLQTREEQAALDEQAAKLHSAHAARKIFRPPL
jgi:anti-sigma factor ChrR (cupin superfamily)